MICGRIGTHPRANLALDDVMAVRNCRECRRLRRSGALSGQALVDRAQCRHGGDRDDRGCRGSKGIGRGRLDTVEQRADLCLACVQSFRRELDHIVQRLLVRGWVAKRSEEHTSELQSLMRISYAVFCLKDKLTLRIHSTIWILKL